MYSYGPIKCNQQQTLQTHNLEAPLVTKWEELPVHDFNSFGELVIISFKTLTLIPVKLYYVSGDLIVGFSYVGEHFDNIVTLCLMYTIHRGIKLATCTLYMVLTTLGYYVLEIVLSSFPSAHSS